jgi:Uncharacterised nucleotidyltransferase
MPTDGESRRQANTAAVLLAIDFLAAEVAGRMDAAGVGCILLKGPALAEWLYPDGSRTYEDCDLLIEPGRRPDAEAVLRDLGFRPYDPPPVAAGLGIPVSRCWMRGWERIDVHNSFWGLTAEPASVWATFAAESVTEVVARREVRMPSRSARVLLVALHAVHHGSGAPQPLADLARALEREPDVAWSEALGLARRLGGEAAFWAAFALLPGGVDRARALGLPRPLTLETALVATGLPVSEGFERLARAEGAVARLRLARAELLPSAEFMRWRYARARSSSTGLALAYAWRLASITRSGLRALRAWLALRMGRQPARYPPRRTS